MGSVLFYDGFDFCGSPERVALTLSNAEIEKGRAMKTLTEDQIVAIEQEHNVWIDRKTLQYNVGGGYDATYGWSPLPEEWINE